MVSSALSSHRWDTRDLVLFALFTALIAIGAFIRIPVPFCPFTLQLLFTTLAGLLLGSRRGAASVAVYVFLGLIGLPVFTSGGGPSYIFQPTFGYLLGFIGGAGLTGYIAHQVPVPSLRRPRHRLRLRHGLFGLDQQRVPGHADQFVDALRLLLRPAHPWRHLLVYRRRFPGPSCPTDHSRLERSSFTMSKGLFITGTGTDIGKTYVTALLIKTLRQHGYDIGYYKAAISGAPTVAASDAGYVNATAGIGEAPDLLLSYLYDHAVSPHLAARWEHKPIEKDVILRDWQRVTAAYPYVTVEGSGGIICPLRDDDQAFFQLEDVISWLHLPSLIVCPAGLGTINGAVLTAFYMKEKGLPVQGFIVNHYTGSPMEKDNIRMIEKLSQKPVLAVVAEDDTLLHADAASLISLYQ